MWYTLKELFVIYIPDEWESIGTSDGYKILAKGTLDKTREFVGITDPVKTCQKIEGIYYFGFPNGLIFQCPLETRGVSAETIEHFDKMKEEDGYTHLCEPDLILLEKGEVYTA